MHRAGIVRAACGAAVSMTEPPFQRANLSDVPAYLRCRLCAEVATRLAWARMGGDSSDEPGGVGADDADRQRPRDDR